MSTTGATDSINPNANQYGQGTNHATESKVPDKLAKAVRSS